MNAPYSVVLIGNCQAEALAWYIRRLPKAKNLAQQGKFVCNWIVAERFKKHLKKIYKKDFKKYPFLHADALSRHRLLTEGYGDTQYNIYNERVSIGKIKNADLIIFQKISKETSDLFNYDNVKRLAKDEAELISISSFFYSEKDPSHLNGMMEREETLRVRLRASELIFNNKKINCHIRPEHPNVHYFLDLMKNICKILGWEYYKEGQLKQFLNLKFPFG